MSDDPELYGLRETYAALLERRVALATTVGQARDENKKTGAFEIGDGWQVAKEILEIQDMMNGIQQIISNLTVA